MQRRQSAWIFWAALGLLSSGCLALRSAHETETFQHQVVREQLVLYSNTPFASEDRLLDELTEQGKRLRARLALPPTNQPIHVFLFADAASYYEFLGNRFPEFHSRRALFVKTDAQLSVYAHWNDHVAKDLRHEVAHGHLHAAVPRLPLWLDEGLAEYFEVTQSKQGLNRPHVDLLLQQKIISDWKPDLARLETLTSAVDLTQRDYAEAWAWVHFLLEAEDDKSAILIDYLTDLRGDAAIEESFAARVRKRLARPELALLEHLQELQ